MLPLRAVTDNLLFGHTHKPHLDHHLGMEIFNPKTIGKVKKPSNALHTIENDNAALEINT